MDRVNKEDSSLVKDVSFGNNSLFSRSDIDINTIYYEISGICNAKCPYCPTGSGATKGRKARFIPPEEFSRGLNRLYELDLLNNDIFFGLFNWGDPFLHPQLNEILHILKEADQSFALSTNGSFLPKNLNSSLLYNLSYIRLSLPGFSQQSYDKVHRLDFESVLQNIGILNELAPPNTLEVLLYAYKFNIEEISRAFDYFSNKNIRCRVAMPHLMDYEEAIGYLTETIDPIKKQRIEDELFTDHIKPLVLHKEDMKSCPYLQNQLVIDEYSNVLTCCVLSKNSEYYTFGSLFELTKDELFDVKTRGKAICSHCMSAGVPYWYEFNCKYLPQELQGFNTQTHCYIDTGYGFSEKQKVTSNVNSRSSRTPFHAFFDMRGFNGIKSLRWDPVEGRLCHISIDKTQVKMKNGDFRLVEPENLATNGERISDNEFRFNTIDPWVVIPAEGQINNIVITGSWLVKDVNETIPHLNQEIVQSNMKIQSLQQTIIEHDAKVASLDEQARQQATQLMQLSNEIASMKQSVVWRLTTMFHTKVIEKLLPVSSRRRRIYDIMIKSGQILVNEGWNSLWMGIKSYLNSDKMGNNEYLNWIKEKEPSQFELDHFYEKANRFQYCLKISIITPVWDTDETILRSAIDSVINQVYVNWELCIVDGGSTKKHVNQVLEDYSKRDNRIKVKFLSENKGIAENSNEALSLATGEYIGFLDHDDELAPFALFEVIKKLNQNPDYQFLYSDEDKIDEEGNRKDPFFKPDWSPDQFLSQNYLCHFTVIQKTLVDSVGGFHKGYDGSQDYDLFLRCTEKIPTDQIGHIPKILYHWRMNVGSAANNPSAKPYAFISAKKALMEALTRRGIVGEVTDGLFLGSYRVRYVIKGNPKVSIIIPTKDNFHILQRCIDSILEKTKYQNFEIVIVDNQSVEQETFHYYEEIRNNPKIRILYYNNPFNYSAINNYAVSQVNSQYILFLNNDTEVISEDWLSAMLEHAQRNGVGAVGGKLLYPNGTVQHAGIIIGIIGDPPIGAHSHRYFADDHPGYFGRLSLIQNVTAVTGACLLTQKEIFQSVGGFDENLTVAFNDVDLCMKIREKGYLIIYTPYAKLFHYESLTRGYEDTPEKKKRFSKEAYYVRKRWGDVIDWGDPYYNENLTKDKTDFSIGCH